MLEPHSAPESSEEYKIHDVSEWWQRIEYFIVFFFIYAFFFSVCFWMWLRQRWRLASKTIAIPMWTLILCWQLLLEVSAFLCQNLKSLFSFVCLFFFFWSCDVPNLLSRVHSEYQILGNCLKCSSFGTYYTNTSCIVKVRHFRGKILILNITQGSFLKRAVYVNTCDIVSVPLVTVARQDVVLMISDAPQTARLFPKESDVIGPNRGENEFNLTLLLEFIIFKAGWEVPCQRALNQS